MLKARYAKVRQETLAVSNVTVIMLQIKGDSVKKKLSFKTSRRDFLRTFLGFVRILVVFSEINNFLYAMSLWGDCVYNKV